MTTEDLGPGFLMQGGLVIVFLETLGTLISVSFCLSFLRFVKFEGVMESTHC
ncbi:MAG: hypothetical protein QG577_738, partial [Thermodesulfobacteriota bacterium]|nr:hypothetical protein [Thermodesulfobacteriota bacterium]